MSPSLFSRRSVLKSATAAGISFFNTSLWTALLSAQTKAAGAKACILIFLEGGPSQIDTFDPKPSTPTGGPFEAIDTKLSGIQFSQHVPRLAAMADQLAVVRTLSSEEGDHDRAQVLMLSGYQPNPRIQYPVFGSTVAWQQSDPAADVPAFVSIGRRFGTSLLGPQFGPFVIEDVSNPAPNLALPEDLTDARLKRRLAALEKFNTQFGQKFQTPLGTDLTELARRADRMRHSEVFQPYDAAASEPELFERYGSGINDGYLARACLMARRLVESGVKFVEVNFGGWDTHDNNFNQVQDLSATLDAGLATLIEDLQERGLLDQTLVCCVGEFGRTPKINGDNGRDHFPNVFSAVLAGGGIKVGQALGESTEDGMEVKDRAVTIPDFHATLFTALGLDVTKDYFAPDGRLLKLTDGGKPVAELI
ncbi:DUF1501 domain-containing protein [Schlesneria sp.]|uniref:DUF1501 domain-containing protein n=1 Tax=Schlesneria sp. TaxID=2762018 RepID=UPI002F0F8E1D